MVPVGRDSVLLKGNVSNTLNLSFRRYLDPINVTRFVSNKVTKMYIGVVLLDLLILVIEDFIYKWISSIAIGV